MGENLGMPWGGGFLYFLAAPLSFRKSTSFNSVPFKFLKNQQSHSLTSFQLYFVTGSPSVSIQILSG
jgi:hypothetical protein